MLRFSARLKSVHPLLHLHRFSRDRERIVELLVQLNNLSHGHDILAEADVPDEAASVTFLLAASDLCDAESASCAGEDVEDRRLQDSRVENHLRNGSFFIYKKRETIDYIFDRHLI